MAREWTFMLSNATVMPEKHNVFPQEWMDRHRLQSAIVMAPEMVAAALEQLGLFRRALAANDATKLYPWRQTSGPGQVTLEIRKERGREAVRALAKYFAMQPADPDYKNNLDKVIKVYEKVHAGLTGMFEIVVFHPVPRKDWNDVPKPERARGFVNTQKPIEKSKQEFLEMKKELIKLGDNGPHKPFGPFGAGKIHLSLSLFVDGGHENGAEAIARTLVHEASHKFAGTKDHLYKHQSFIGTLDDDKLAEAFEVFDLEPSTVEKYGYTYKFGKAVGRGPVMPMYGFDPKDKSELISTTDKFIENADSYAWAARRIWKRYR
jgi:hypothetical protein